ncbi:MAG: hypothetical protein ABEJ05_13575 [Haloglomus sp.]
MVSDDELQRHVNRVETEQSRRSPDVPTIGTGDGPVEERVDELQHAARETHAELARRIRRVDEASPDVARVDDLADRLTEIESRLTSIEEELAD